MDSEKLINTFGMKNLIIYPWGKTLFFKSRRTLDQLDPLYFLTLYHFKYTYSISFKKFSDVLKTS